MSKKDCTEQMLSFWRISEHYKQKRVSDVFSSLNKAFLVDGTEIGRSPISIIKKTKVDDRFYYVKTYTRGGKRLRRYLGRSRIRAEWENLMFFDKLGIPTPKVVAYGQEVGWGILRRGALITEEIEGAKDLANLAQERSPLLRDPSWIRQVSEQLGRFTRMLHRERFIHSDLKWRNILVTCKGKPGLFLIDCPQGRKWRGFMLRRGIIKDLACLDRMAKGLLTRTQRLWFYKAYKGCGKLTRQDKHQIRKVLAFFSGR